MVSAIRRDESEATYHLQNTTPETPVIIPLQTTVLSEATAAAQQYSATHPALYVRLGSCFDLHLAAENRLHIFAPSSCPWWLPDEWRGYWKGGKFRPFTTAQAIADERATPTMA